MNQMHFRRLSGYAAKQIFLGYAALTRPTGLLTGFLETCHENPDTKLCEKEAFVKRLAEFYRHSHLPVA